MYSGTLLTKYSGRLMGAHQKIDRVARRHLGQLMACQDFPPISLILHFEGRNGPDGIKLKSPAKDEPWHYFKPFDDADNQLTDVIWHHFNQLVKHLKDGNYERSAFEAAWLSHALVDGLTPAHHFPYEEKLIELRGGEGVETRTSLKAKLIMPGINLREQLRNNWKMWGPKGLLSTHGFFEDGVAMLIAPLPFTEAAPTEHELKNFLEIGVEQWFRNIAREIAVMDMYTRYYQTGWTPRLASEVRRQLVPRIIKTVTLSWCAAAHAAGLTEVRA